MRLCATRSHHGRVLDIPRHCPPWWTRRVFCIGLMVLILALAGCGSSGPSPAEREAQKEAHEIVCGDAFWEPRKRECEHPALVEAEEKERKREEPAIVKAEEGEAAKAEEGG